MPDNNAVCASLVSQGFAVTLRSFTAIDRYLGRDTLPFALIETNADVTELSRLFEGLRFPGVDLADAAVESGDRIWYFRCLDPDEPLLPPGYCLLDFYQDWKTGRFLDPNGIYPLLRRLRACESIEEWWQPGKAAWYGLLMDAALILSRYEAASSPGKAFFKAPSGERDPGPEAQRALLLGILASPRPERGFEFLKASGFVGKFWPELAALDDVDHSKEFHPEGNVWNHTMETFRHRKPGSSGEFDMRLSLGLLLHDAGKPLAFSSGSRRFDGHAELGARTARRFMERLGFEHSLIEDIFYLVKNHMLPAALKRLPLTRTEEIMASPLFPALMELYRCDEASSFKGPGGYYENSAAYHSYLRNLRNPYRSADGKILGKKAKR
jgi:poly(A) polymerase